MVCHSLLTNHCIFTNEIIVMIRFHFLNGQIVPASSACLPISDLGIGRGYGIFDYLQVRQQVPLYLSEHLQRMYNSCRIMRLPIPFDEEELKSTILELIRVNGMEDAGIKIIVTGGHAGNGFQLDNPNVAIQVLPFGQARQDWMENGAPLISYYYQRPIAEAKTTNYMVAVYLQDQVEKAGAVEPLYYTDASVRESSRANIFAVYGDKLVTPAHHILQGITRRHTIEWASINAKIEVRDLPMEELLQADELFLTGTMKMGLPIIQIDEHLIGNGKPGPVTRQVQKMLQLYERDYLASHKLASTSIGS